MPTQSHSHWHRALLSSTANVQEAIRNLDASALQIALVVSSDGRLEGSLTDGDIRRGLLRGCTLETPIVEVMFPTPMVVPPDMERELALQLMRANRLHHLPVVDASRRVVGLHLRDEMLAPVNRPNLMVIMAGGLGKRLRPHTEDCPKPMLEVGGKPMLEHIIVRARKEGFKHFVLAIRYLSHMIESYFGDGSQWDIEIEYLREDTPLGTAGALGLLTQAPERPVVVTNGDVLTDIRYSELLEFHQHHHAAATMSVRQHEWQHPFGVVHTRGIEIVGFEEKPLHRSNVNAGIYVIDPTVLVLIERNEACDMPTLFERAQQQGFKTIAYPMHEPWLDVGRPDDLARARMADGAPVK
jgi:dTDP-glucose pyrophosphorylase